MIADLVQLDLDAPITPGRGLAGLEVGIPIVRLSDALLQAELKGGVVYSLVSLFEATYGLMRGAVEIAVDVRNGKIARLTARSGYQGRLTPGIGIGMLVREAIRLDSRFYYDEGEERVLCRGVPGVSIDVARVDPTPADVPQLPIEVISVYHEALDSAAGQTGRW